MQRTTIDDRSSQISGQCGGLVLVSDFEDLRNYCLRAVELCSFVAGTAAVTGRLTF